MGESFIAEARREQIIQSCIDTLEEVGYTKVSLTKIAKKAKVSTGLISYHFSDKMDLINQTLLYLLEKKLDFISGKVVQEETPTSQLTAYIEACLAYQVANFKYNIALIEIVFNVENEEGIPFYRADNGEEDEDPIYTLLKEILLDGQQKKEFSNQFDVEMICVLIQGAIEESMLKHNKTFSFEKYKNELIKMVLKIVI
ncbi:MULTISPECIES: TetR/AcrR family transcriptional regulator [Bacillales]|uniref:TetR family transcriptional regulator n=2 Tax=Bacillales TaxID=1385 RepID=A0ABX7E110_9BACI|nr:MULTISPECIES: TetR/AcrR family transcriptional regulator [Bacillaceae]SLL32050.1 Putative transcriptional regulator, TetR family [Mycobacteroides abscessus subsp. abscessus]HWL25371.1 TetR/AcrR family transcriptional regulator [Ureibacillus sp.]MCM3361265.1 TetR family transcriptional regulator [Niallia sp. MER TA 168]MCM3570471.1 TetR family transcriptional regulator [Neobacillus mesonae]MDQ0156833.1 AcrR family transcriptional regulator [Robertmurraya andreesenii]